MQNELCRAYSHVFRYPQASNPRPGLGLFFFGVIILITALRPCFYVPEYVDAREAAFVVHILISVAA